MNGPLSERRILVVDDQEMVRTTSQRILEMDGFSCDGAGSVAEAKAQMAATKYDLVLLDMYMPEQTGMALLSHIQAEHPGTAVIVVSAVIDPDMVSEARRLGAAGYLLKPVRAGALRALVSKTLQMQG